MTAATGLPSIPPLKRLWQLIKVDKKEITNIYLYAIFAGLVNLSLPLGIQAIINLIQGGEVSTSWILLVVIVILGVAMTGFLQIMQLTITESIQQKIFTRSAFEFAYRIPRIKFSAVYQSYAPELVNRFFDTLSVQKGLSKILIDFSSALLQVLFGLILLSLYHPFFVLFGIGLVLIVFLIIRLTGPSGMRTSIMESKYKYEVAHWLEEVARTMFTFKLAGKTDLPLERTDGLVGNYLKSRKAHFRILVVQYANMVGFKVIVAAGLLIIGSLLVFDQQLNLGQFVAAEIIILLIINSVEKVILSMETIYDVLTALEKIGNVTDLPLENEEGEQFEEEHVERGMSLELRDVSYTFPYSQNPILKRLNFKVDPGEKVCVSGPNSSGKSTLIHLMAGLYEVSQGTISYNELPIGNLNIGSLRSFIGDSLSHEEIFKGTLMENIAIGRERANLANVRWAVEQMGLADFVKTLPKGLNTELDPEGRKLSRSITRKLILARSIADKPRLLLIEDAMSVIQLQERLKILNCLTDKNNPWTLILVSNNREVAERCDRVVILNEGEIVDDGPITELQSHHWFKSIFDAEH